MSSFKPLVSVILPVYNGAHFIEDALASIQQQSYEPIEIIVINDGSTDHTADILANSTIPIHYIFQENQGPATARNKGIQVAQGTFLTFLDADDLWLDKLPVQVPLLRSHTSADIVIGHTRIVRLLNGESQANQKEEILAKSRFELLLGSSLFRAEVFKKIGLFDNDVAPSEDWDWFMRAREREIPIVIHPEPVLCYRQHESNLTRDRELSHQSYLRALRKSLSRRRKQGISKKLPPWSKFRNLP